MQVRIGVVDTGVDGTVSCFRHRRLEGVSIRREGAAYRYEGDYTDLHGHGTSMASRIQSLCPEAEIVAVRIAQQDSQGAVVRVQEKLLALGIEWCVEQEIKIVNVSYSIAEVTDDGGLAEACRKAKARGTVVVAAYRNDEPSPVYPAAFPSVLGVRRCKEFRPGEVRVLSEANHDLIAWGSSTSIACAHVSAWVGRLYLRDPALGVEAVLASLKEVAVPGIAQEAAGTGVLGGDAAGRDEQCG